MRERFREEILEAAARERPTAFVYVNLHNFKPLNVVLGHARCDEYLARVQRGLEQLGRVWRVGGDQFVAFGATADVAARARAFAWLFHVVVGATEAWRFTFADGRSAPITPWRRFDVVCMPRIGIVALSAEDSSLVPAMPAMPAAPAALAEALQLAEARCEEARDPRLGPWQNEETLAARICPICSATSLVAEEEDLGWAREQCDACGVSYERSDVLFVLGEELPGGYA